MRILGAQEECGEPEGKRHAADSSQSGNSHMTKQAFAAMDIQGTPWSYGRKAL